MMLWFPLLAALGVQAQILDLTQLNATQIRALDREKTVVILPGGMIEEHGPYLPAYTDGILSEQLTKDISRAVAAAKPDWKVLVFPQISVGASGSNELGGKFSFAGTYAVRPSTLRSVFMDLASELGEQGFKWVFIVHVHGAPWHNHVLDQACDYFHDVYGGRMVHLWGLVPVLSAWGKAMQDMTPAEKKEDGVSLHAGMDETSLLLYLRPQLVSKDHAKAPAVSGANLEDAFKTAGKEAWPGYLGSPRIATKEWGRKIWTALSTSASTHALLVLNGADPKQFVRYADLLQKNPWYQHWIKAAGARDREQDTKQREWLSKQPDFEKAPTPPPNQ
jgi:creatinine amidohydrolase/Fe(II)-dependent formamide hydrolase-like protein